AHLSPGSPFTGGGLPGPWVATIDGNDNVWVSNFAGTKQSHHGGVWRAHRELSARVQDRRPDLAARRVRRWRSADSDRPRDRPGGRRLGDGQLGGHRQLL